MGEKSILWELTKITKKKILFQTGTNWDKIKLMNFLKSHQSAGVMSERKWTILISTHIDLRIKLCIYVACLSQWGRTRICMFIHIFSVSFDPRKKSLIHFSDMTSLQYVSSHLFPLLMIPAIFWNWGAVMQQPSYMPLLLLFLLLPLSCSHQPYFRGIQVGRLLRKREVPSYIFAPFLYHIDLIITRIHCWGMCHHKV